jgi:hypothetical protein
MYKNEDNVFIFNHTNLGFNSILIEEDIVAGSVNADGNARSFHNESLLHENIMNIMVTVGLINMIAMETGMDTVMITVAVMEVEKVTEGDMVTDTGNTNLLT